MTPAPFTPEQFSSAWRCEQHPTQPFPHGKCLGPGFIPSLQERLAVFRQQLVSEAESPEHALDLFDRADLLERPSAQEGGEGSTKPCGCYENMWCNRCCAPANPYDGSDQQPFSEAQLEQEAAIFEAAVAINDHMLRHGPISAVSANRAINARRAAMLRQAAQQARQLAAYHAAADKFIAKVESGRAISRETYADLKAARSLSDE